MDLLKLAEPFPADDIEWRVQSSGLSGGNPWARVLAYVTARAIMARLDEVAGPENWRPRYTYEGGGVMCHLSILCGSDMGAGEWVEKSDGAEQTDIEKFKGGISSALKRAASVWGIGRYLYKLDTGFAECDKNTKRFPNWGKTKEGTQFSWKPPELPEWALPGAPKAKKKTKKAEKAEKAEKSEAHHKARPDITFATASQTREIGMLKTDIGVSDEAYRSILFTDFGVETAKDLPTAGKRSAGELIDRLKKRKAFMLEQEAKEAFGDGNGREKRVAELRKSALGFCETVKRMGGTYRNKSPIDYKKEGLVVTSLEELVQLITAMEDEKELEGVITHLDALVQTMSF